MPDDPRKAETLDEAARNPDGTYNGYRAMSWLSEALHPGAGIAEDEVRRMHELSKKLDAPGRAELRGLLRNRKPRKET